MARCAYDLHVGYTIAKITLKRPLSGITLKYSTKLSPETEYKCEAL